MAVNLYENHKLHATKLRMSTDAEHTIDRRWCVRSSIEFIAKPHQFTQNRLLILVIGHGLVPLGLRCQR